MKFLETHFEEYTNSVENSNLHQKFEKIYSKFPKKIEDFDNLIIYGPNGVGKYSQTLKIIKKYSPTELKYEKKLTITYDKKEYYFKISDIHFEIDMSLLGCNSKILWHEIYQQIIDILLLKNNKSGIIVCKNFHDIHSELLENFYSYIQDNNSLLVNVKYIFITEQLSFIPDLILNCCEVININRPTKTTYTKCIKHKIPSVESITNIKCLNVVEIDELNNPHKIICDKIMNEMIEIDKLKYLKFRDLLYDIFIYNLNINDCIWYIITSLIEKKYIKPDKKTNILIKTYIFFKYYNNNYRPIYHLESYLFYLVSIIHEY